MFSGSRLRRGFCSARRFGADGLHLFYPSNRDGGAFGIWRQNGIRLHREGGLCADARRHESTDDLVEPSGSLEWAEPYSENGETAHEVPT